MSQSPQAGGWETAAAGQPSAQASPSASDVLFGRACLSFGLVGREQLYACVADQRRLAEEGRPYTLAQVMIGRKLMTAAVYQQVVDRIRQRLQQGPDGAHEAPPAPPDITASGRYHDVAAVLRAGARADPAPGREGTGRLAGPPRDEATPGAPAAPGAWGGGAAAQAPPLSPEQLAQAARSWDHASSVVEGDYEVLAESGESTASVEPAPAADPGLGLATERKDTGIRRLLGVDDAANEFDFGPYRILGEVAAGGMGVIYRALASDTGRVYALKALMNVEQANEKQLRRFIQEAQSAMRLDHPGIVRIHDIGIFENIPYFTMDLIEGRDLQHHLREGSFPREQLLSLIVQVCQAVHYAHEHQVIHRDLKPANIIVRDADRQPILTDFGLAKNLDSSFKLTSEGAMVGTPLFLSPEQVSGKGHEVDRRCDVYGLGVMLYQVLTERLPFMGRNPYEVYRKVLEEDPRPPREHDASIGAGLELICLMALAKDREERYPTAGAMGEDLERFLRGEPVEAKLPRPAVKPVRGKKGAPPSATKSAARKDADPGRFGVVVAVAAVVAAAAVAVIIYLVVLAE